MLGKKWVFLLFVVLSLFALISCGKNSPTGLAGAGKVKLTETPTPTPDVNFTVYIHQEATAVYNVQLTIRSMVTGATMTAKTNASGLGGFEVHSGGQWNLQVDGFNGFKTQAFTVEPLTNTFYAVNYGIPSLDLELVSGSETIGIAPSTLVYKVTYHTRFEREGQVMLERPNSVDMKYAASYTVKNEGDFVTCILNIPKSFEEYNNGGKLYKFKASCVPNNGENTISDDRTWTKDWIFNVNVNLLYAQVFAYDDNNRRVIYYAGVSGFDADYSYNIPFIKTVRCQILDGDNIGADGSGTTVNAGTCMPWYTNYGCFLSLLKINTNAVFVNNGLQDNNNGRIKVRFYDEGYLDLIREVETGNWAWSNVCSYWCCTSAPLNGLSRGTNECHSKAYKMPYGMCGYPWDDNQTADAKRIKSGTVNSTQ